MANSASGTIDAIEGSRDRIAGVCAGLDAAGWHRATPLPVWDVQDVVAHLASLEGVLLGRAEPAHEAAEVGHARNPLGVFNEHLVDRRRSWTGAQVLEEFREVTDRRLQDLRDLDEGGLDVEVLAPNGRMVPLRDFLGIRVWDYFVHELDIAVALGLPLPIDTPAGRRVLDELLGLAPRALAKAGAADGTVLVIELGGPLPRVAAARVDAGRGSAIDPAAAGEAALHLRASPAAFLLTATGRRAPEEAIEAGDVNVAGDGELARHVLARLNVLP